MANISGKNLTLASYLLVGIRNSYNETLPGVATVITQLANTIIRAIEQDRKVRETEEIEERLAALEARTESDAGREAA